MPSPDCDAQSLHCKAARLLKEISTECIDIKIYRVTTVEPSNESSFNELVSEEEEGKEGMRNILREEDSQEDEPFQLSDDKEKMKDQLVRKFWSKFHTFNPEKARDYLVEKFINKSFSGDSSNGRYSDKCYPKHVFYSTLDLKTSEAEVKYHNYKLVKEFGPIHKQCFSCVFTGKAKDLRNNQGEYPELVDENYCFCQKIGAIAHGSKLDGLVVPSARKEDGSCLPVFNKCALSDPKYLGQIELTFDPGNEKVNIEEVPLAENN